MKGFLFSIGRRLCVPVADPVDKTLPLLRTTTAANEEERIVGGEEKAPGIVRRLVKGFKSMFAANRGGAEERREIVIGYPTVVVRLSYIPCESGPCMVSEPATLTLGQHLQIAAMEP